MSKNISKNQPIVIGLTGSIGMGKSTAAKILKSFGLPVFSADEAVHNALKHGGKGVLPIAKFFPESIQRGAVNPSLLGKIVFHDRHKLKKLESILHPLVLESEKLFLEAAKKRHEKAVVLEIPLLFETNAQKRCDITICMTAPRFLQKERVMKRRNMTTAKFYAILKRQMADSKKRRRADFVINTAGGMADTKKQMNTVWQHIQKIKHERFRA